MAEFTKAEYRRLVRQRRGKLTEAQLASRSERLTSALDHHVRPTAVVAGYLPMRGEPDLLPFLTRHAAGPGTVFLPVIPSTGRHLQWAAWTPATPLRRHPTMPLSEPDPESAGAAGLDHLFQCAAQNASGPGSEPDQLIPADLVLLVPALAVDGTGARLGQGGGYYDTTMQRLPHCADLFPEVHCEVIAVVHSEELVAQGSFPALAHDLRAVRVVTECGIVEL